MRIDWEKLANIRELQEYFEADAEGFRARIEHHIRALDAIAPEELDNLAILRVLEITNGCTQWGFRRQDEQCLSADRTRDCMKMVIGFIKAKKIEFPDRDPIRFSPAIERLIDEGRDLYQAAFKKNVAGADREYYAYSTAQFLVYGRDRAWAAMRAIADAYEAMFSPYYIQRGRNYIAPYLDAIGEPEPTGVAA